MWFFREALWFYLIRRNDTEGCTKIGLVSKEAGEITYLLVAE